MPKRETLLLKLWSRQKGNCHLCGQGMSRQKNKENSVTFDHIIPKSIQKQMGLTYIANNTKLACFRCNILRGNKPLNEGKKLIQEKLKAQVAHSHNHSE